MKWTLIVLLLHFSTVYSSPIPGCSVSAEEGETVILPVKVHLAQDSKISNPTITWKNEAEEVVHQYRNEQDYNVNQIEHFQNRTSLFKEEIIKGNVSLTIFNVTKHDAGTYTWKVLHRDPDIKKTYKVSLCVTEKDEDPMEIPKPKQPDQTKGCSVKAEVGETVILPVKVDLPQDSELLHPIISWVKESGGIVHDYWSNIDYNEHQIKHFKNRTSLFNEEIVKGNVSLKIRNITKSDAGEYICEVHDKDRNTYKVSLCVMEKENHEYSVEKPEPEQPGLTTDQTVGTVIGVLIVLAALAAALIGVFLYRKLTLTEKKPKGKDPDAGVETEKLRGEDP